MPIAECLERDPSGAESRQALLGHASADRYDGDAPQRRPAGSSHIVLQVNVPADKHKWFTAIYYAFWSGNTVVRLGTNGLPVIPLQQFKTLLSEAATVVSGFEISGLVLSGGEGVLALKDVCLAIAATWRARTELSRTKPAHEEARAKFRTHLAGRQQRMADRQSAERMDAGQILDPEGEGEPADPADPAGPSAADEDGHGQAVGSDAAKARVSVTFRTVECDGHLAHTEAKRQHSNAMLALRSSLIAGVRDFAVQGARVVIEVLKKTAGSLFSPFLGHLMPWIFSVGMGVFHLVAAAHEWRQAGKSRALAKQVLEQAARNEVIIGDDAKRSARLRGPLSAEALRHFRTSLNAACKQAGRERCWAFLRFLYGGFSVLSGAGTVVAGVLVGLSFLTGIGGAIIGVAAIAVGLGWLCFAIYRAYQRIGMAKAERIEREQTRAALDANPATRGKTIAECQCGDIQRLVAEHPDLRDNRHVCAAMLAKRLLIDDEDDKALTKKERLDVSTTLQTLGMKKEMTTILKRASFEQAHETIYRYLCGDAAQYEMLSGSFHRMAQPSAPSN